MPDLEQKFGYVRNLIEHEDELVNHRTNWTLIFHGLLFTAFVGGVGLIDKVNFKVGSEDAVTIGIGVACALGIVSALAAFVGVRTAERQLQRVTAWWLQQPGSTHANEFPPIYTYSKRTAWFGSSAYFLVLAGVWLILLWLVITSESAPQPITPATPASCCAAPLTSSPNQQR